MSQNSQETHVPGSFLNKIAGLRPAILLKKETLAEVLPCEICQIAKNAYSYRIPLVAASLDTNVLSAKQSTELIA